MADADVLKCLRMLTFLPLEQIDEMDKWEGSQLNQAKEILAYEPPTDGKRNFMCFRNLPSGCSCS